MTELRDKFALTMNARGHRRARRGFTLIELILALALVGMVAFSLYGSLMIAFAAARSTDTAIEPSRTADLAMELIANDLQNAVTPNTNVTLNPISNANNIAILNEVSSPLNGNASTTNALASNSATTAGTTPESTAAASPAGGTTTPLGWVLAGQFEGTQNTSAQSEADDLTFFTINDSPEHVDGTGEMKWVELTLDQPKGSDEPCLVRKVTGNLTTEATPVIDEEILCRGVNSLQFLYFDGTNWLPNWDSTVQDNTIPVAVQVILTLKRPRSAGGTQILTYTREFLLAQSTAAQDTNVNGVMSP
jgi:prepilin-type N-terminal cleavage/methylation domain-containing protein